MIACSNYAGMRASNWKQRNVGYRRGDMMIHKVTDITIFTAYKSPTAILSVNAIKNSESDQPDIYLHLGDLTVADLEQMKEQIDLALVELKS